MLVRQYIARLVDEAGFPADMLEREHAREQAEGGGNHLLDANVDDGAMPEMLAPMYATEAYVKTVFGAYKNQRAEPPTQSAYEMVWMIALDCLIVAYYG